LRHLPAAVVLLALVPVIARAAGDHGFQLEVDAVGSRPFGTYEAGARAADLFDFGGNAGGKALFGLSRGLYVGVGVGYLHNQKDFSFTFRPSFGAPLVTVTGIRSLNTIPVLALAQLRSDTHRTLSWYGEGGLGIATFNGRLTDFSYGLAPVSDFQQAFSFTVGAGACLGVGRTWDVLLGAGWLQSFTRGGTMFEGGDNPAYVLYSLGLRYPRW